MVSNVVLTQKILCNIIPDMNVRNNIRIYSVLGVMYICMSFANMNVSMMSITEKFINLMLWIPCLGFPNVSLYIQKLNIYIIEL